MDAVNPLYIPRTYLVEEALEAADTGEMKAFNRLLKAVQMPFQDIDEYLDLAMPPPEDKSFIQTFCET